ncbi:indole-3-pyruvate decarboxylase [Bradyrhizobium centrolobii]|uniref:Indole-3-pyruvate decarboxylase n=1 Tax=Bradyrhizobium centrolobii TaxID=1505087 RepID=A0A176YTW8_9BRAD|nr:thiamine pyrophosphate-binding protein [Bradyrhizobium centrolobii]OAF10225.1 indole-3-pyruvate decarboxylase [Bradyrhizobium centrolobii]
MPTVIEYVLSRLRDIGVGDVFGVPGDFSFPLNDAISTQPGLRWIGCCNELDAGYAADGYARLKGVGAICTTAGVGELSAMNAIAGACAERVPLFHLVGTPAMSAQSARAIVHHTLGDGEFDAFRRMSGPVVCASAVMTPQNVVRETERLIFEARHHLRPVYMSFPFDLASRPAQGHARPIEPPGSDPDVLRDAVEAILAALDKAKTACVLPGFLAARAGLRSIVQAIVDASGLPFATMFTDKAILDERQPAYLGMYVGRLMNEDVREFVESRDVVLAIGSLFSDLNTGAFTTRIDPARLIAINDHDLTICGRRVLGVEMADVLAALAKRLKWGGGFVLPRTDGISRSAIGSGSEPITAAALYPRWADFMRSDDIVVAEAGTAFMGLGLAELPTGVDFLTQSLWASIGWATPAALGAAVAAPHRRVMLFTGEGAHQCSIQEISQFARLGLTPVIFVLNNGGYLIERLLCRDPSLAYNDIAAWRYAEMPSVFGCDGWMSARVTTCGELDQALERASVAETGVYIEVVTPPYESPPLPLRLQEMHRARSPRR